MNTNQKTDFLSETTQKIRTETRKTADELAAVETKIGAGLAKDGADVEKQTEALIPLYVKRDLLKAKLDRDRAALFNAVVQDARQAADAATVLVEELQAKKRALRDIWGGQVKADTKDSGARHLLTTNSKFWPAELRENDSALIHARRAASEAHELLAQIDWEAYEDRRRGGLAMPQVGSWKTREAFWSEAAKRAPELGRLDAVQTGTRFVNIA